jgi:hypothetical protein
MNTSIRKYLILFIVGFFTITAEAATITTSYNDSINFTDTLNSTNPSVNGSFDISSILTHYNDSGFTINSAMITASAYSTAETSQEIIRGPLSSPVISYRDTSYGYIETYSCGPWGSQTCSRPVTISRTARDVDYNRDIDHISADRVIDEMELQIGGVNLSETVQRNYTASPPSTTLAYRTGSFARGYTSEYETHRYINDIWAGNIILQQAITPLLNDALSSGLSALDWNLLATVGHISLRYLRLDVNYSYNSTNVNAVPLPAAIWLFGSSLIGLIGMRRRKNSP